MDSPQQYQYSSKNESEKDNSEQQEEDEEEEYQSSIDQNDILLEQDDLEIQEIIYPYQTIYDEKYQRIYYNNKFTNESLWELPKEYQDQLKEYKKKEEEEKQAVKYSKQIRKYVDAGEIQKNKKIEEQQKEYMKRPARKQLQMSLSEQFAYKQGELEYNVWYDKFLSDSNDKYKQKEAAVTKCDPELDSGYTSADLKEGFVSYICIHFIRGCCSEGVNCKYYHRIPSLEECKQVDSTKDIFGRNKHTNYREDMTGIGIFSEENASIVVSEYKGLVNTTSQNYIKSTYELLFRHFSAFGLIHDIIILEFKGSSIIQYKHRCMAEIAKEAMMLRGLDDNEILTIKWATKEQLQSADQTYQYKDFLNSKSIINDTIIKKVKPIQDQFTYHPGHTLYDYHQSNKQLAKSRSKQIQQDCIKMQLILQNIEKQNSLSYQQDQDPQENDQPLLFNK